MGSVQRRVSSFLNHPDHRGRWFDTRAICQAVYGKEWAAPAEMVRTRQALNALEKRREIIRFGSLAEWRTAKGPEREPPNLVKSVEAELGPRAAEILRELEPDLRRIDDDG